MAAICKVEKNTNLFKIAGSPVGIRNSSSLHEEIIRGPAAQWPPANWKFCWKKW